MSSRFAKKVSYRCLVDILGRCLGRLGKSVLRHLKDVFLPAGLAVIPPLVRWGTPGNCSNRGEILGHSGGIKTELKKLEYLKFVKNLSPERVKYS